MAKIKISKEEVKQMIKEEYFKKLTEIKLKNRLHQINEEMQQIASEDMEDEGLEEVKTGGEDSVRSTAWTGDRDGDKKFKPEFEKKGSHLVEDEETSDDIVVDELPADDESLEGDSDIDAILAKLADAIEDKIETTVDEKMGEEESMEEMPYEEAPEEEMSSEEIPEEGVVKEQDGESVAQEQEPKNKVPFDNGKAEIPKKDQLVSEATMKRMQVLSGIRPNDFNE